LRRDALRVPDARLHYVGAIQQSGRYPADAVGHLGMEAVVNAEHPAASVDDRLLRAIDAADKACTSMTAFGPVNDKWMRGFLAALAAEGLAIVEAEWVLERADADDLSDLSYDRETISGHNESMDDPRYEEEPCFDCDGAGCETCNDTGMLYTQEAIRLQLEAEESDDNA
jgi:hypothetical protein